MSESKGLLGAGGVGKGEYGSIQDETPLLSPSELNYSSSRRAMEAGGGHGGDEEEERNKLGTINGVYVPCLLNIMGVILFLRLGWATGEVGWAGVWGMFTLAEVLAVLTVLSLTAMVTNGTMRGGGSYYMISRSLGPELGGAIGLLFYIAYAVGASFYVIGFATSYQSTFLPTHDEWWILPAVGSVLLVVVLAISLAGAKYFTKINVFLFVIQFGSIMIGLLCMYVTKPRELEPYGNFTGLSWENFKDNAGPGYDHGCDDNTKCNFQTVFAIIFPAATGIMEGANLSGDLEKPSKSIGKGTLWAVVTSYIIYIWMVLTFAAAFPRDTLLNNYTVLQDVTWSQYIVVCGLFISTGSSALGAVFGGSRVLQALARDKLFPKTSWLGVGSKKGDEPRRAVVMTWAICQACLFVGDLDVIAPIISSFFCLSYAMVNFACFLLAVSGTPNFRPRFKYWSWWSSLLGGIMSLCTMFFLQYWYGVISVTCLILVIVYLAFRAPNVSWGDVRQAIIFHQVRKYLLRLDETNEHGKLWRPSILLFPPADDSPLVGFCNSLKKGGLYIIAHVLVGDFTECHVFAEQRKRELLGHIESTKNKAFPQVSVAPTMRVGVQNLLATAGLGALTPNTVVMPLVRLPNHRPTGISSSNSIGHNLSGADGEAMGAALAEASSSGNFIDMDRDDYVAVLGDVTSVNKNLILAANFDRYMEDTEAKGHTIDVWLTDVFCTDSWDAFLKGAILLLQLAYVLEEKNRDSRRKTPIRVFRVLQESAVRAAGRSVNGNASAGDAIDREALVADEQDNLGELIEQARFDVAEVTILYLESPAAQTVAPTESGHTENPQYYQHLNNLMREHTDETTDVVFAQLPELHEDSNATAYMRKINSFVDSTPPICLVRAARGADVMSLDM